MVYKNNRKLYNVPVKMKTAIICIFCCLSLAGCKTLDEASEEQGLGSVGDSIGSFELTPTQPNQYWYDGTIYDYNRYEIEITSEPTRAKILWNGKQVGATGFIFKYTGKLDGDDEIEVKALPFDTRFISERKVLRGSKPLPRKVHFNFNP